jgi:hypothetical protein
MRGGRWFVLRKTKGSADKCGQLKKGGAAKCGNAGKVWFIKIVGPRLEP